MITAEYASHGQSLWRRVEVDPAAGQVVFYRCHYPQKFFAWGPDQEYRCPLADLRGAYRNQRLSLGSVLEVVTPAGWAILPESAAGFTELRTALLTGLGPEAKLRWWEYPAVQSLLGLLILFPAGLLATILISWSLERELLSAPIICGFLSTMIVLGFSLVALLRWQGKLLW
jgi:hypothetical protein